MINHPYISIRIAGNIDNTLAKEWFNTVVSEGPNGIVGNAEIFGDNKQTRFYAKKDKYIVVLNRNLSADEAAKIAKKWNDVYTNNNDFEIDWSQNPEIDSRVDKLKADTLRAIALESSKRLHNKWTNDKISEGWRYGQKYSKINKTNPLLTSWENLSDKHKIVEYNRFLKLIEVLNEMNMTITKKG